VAAPVRRSRQPTAKLSSGGRACARAATLGLTTEDPRSLAGRTQGNRSAASSPRYLRDDVTVVEILDSSRRTHLHCSMPISRDACSRSESGSIRWGAAGAGVAAPREGVRAVPAVTGRHVRVTVGGVIYQICSEALGAGQDVLCMNTASADTARLVSAGSPRAWRGLRLGVKTETNLRRIL